MTEAQTLLARPFATVSELIALHARERPTKRALVQDDRALTYAELDAALTRFAAGLQREGVGRRAVAIISSTTLETAIAYLGALRAGCTAAPLAPSSTPEQLASMINDCGAPIVFVDAATSAVLPPVAAQIVRLDALESWISRGDASPTPVTIEPSDPFNIIYSSGTTGTPKGIMHTHAMRWAQIAVLGIAAYGDAVTMVATPLYSNTTLVSFLPTIAYGGTAVLLGKFEARHFLTVAERERATHVMLVPVQYQRIMQLPDFDRFNLKSFIVKLCTSAPFSAELKADVLRRWPGYLLEVYGMTEGGGTCVLIANQFPDKLHTVGRPAMGSDIRLIDEQGREVPRGEIGEVVGRSAQMMVGYHGRPDATRAAEWIDAQGNRFIRHGDLGRFDEDGFLTLLGRSKDMIISGGFNIYPADIEAVLLQHPAVADCAVVGVASEAWGETPYAFYVPKEAGVNTAELVAWVNARVGKTQRISNAEAVDELPRSPIGKVLKRELRDRLNVRRA
jgi:acyl-CoA synthetase (AMP-forming)/AMP-acid ligase II